MTTKLISLADAAERLGVSVSTIWRWEREGHFKFVQLPGGGLRIRESDVDAISDTSRARS